MPGQCTYLVVGGGLVPVGGFVGGSVGGFVGGFVGGSVGGFDGGFETGGSGFGVGWPPPPGGGCCGSTLLLACCCGRFEADDAADGELDWGLSVLDGVSWLVGSGELDGVLRESFTWVTTGGVPSSACPPEVIAKLATAAHAVATATPAAASSA